MSAATASFSRFSSRERSRSAPKVSLRASSLPDLWEQGSEIYLLGIRLEEVNSFILSFDAFALHFANNDFCEPALNFTPVIQKYSLASLKAQRTIC